jgi:hypothetical protein
MPMQAIWPEQTFAAGAKIHRRRLYEPMRHAGSCSEDYAAEARNESQRV